jgi:predicted restriction endonuclease
MTSVEWPDGKIVPLLIVGMISSPEFLSHLSEFISTVETFKEITADRDVNNELDRDALEADREGNFDPGNARETAKKIIQAITLRRGQPEFRRKLLQAYGDRCAITGCDCLDALEAAHIRPYGGESTNHVQNGILLRSDLHTLFDIGKVGIDPDTGLIVVAKSLLTTVYGKLNGKKLRRTSRASQLPNKDVLREHLEKWRLS